jgi:hypothetical protein
VVSTRISESSAYWHLELKVERSTWFGGRGAVESARELVGAGGGNGGSVLRLERTRGRQGRSEDEGQHHGALEALATWPVGPQPTYGQHGASTWRQQPMADRPPSSARSRFRDWRSRLTADLITLNLPNWLDLGHDVINKIGEPYEYYKVVNWILSWFGLVWEIQCSQVGHMKTVNCISDLENFQLWNSSGFLSCGAFLGMLCTFSWVGTLQILFFIKFSRTLFKVAHPCKISRLDFLNSQTKTLYRSSYGETSPRGQISQFG